MVPMRITLLVPSTPDGGFGAPTRFGTRNPIYYPVRGSGIGMKQVGSSRTELGYLAGDAGNPGDDSLFTGLYGPGTVSVQAQR